MSNNGKSKFLTGKLKRFRPVGSFKSIQLMNIPRLLCMLLVNAAVQAADFRIENDRLYISGYLDIKQEETFLRNLNATPPVKTIVFEKCLGGDGAAAIQFSRLIRAKGIDTLVKGQSSSACAIAFLAGKRRSFDKRWPVSGVTLHMSRPKDNTKVRQESRTDQVLMELLDEFTRGQMTDPVRSLIRNSWLDNAGVIFVVHNYFFFARYKTMYCDGSQGANLSNCPELKNVDPFALGLFTNNSDQTH